MDSEVDADIKTLSLPASTTISTFAKTFLDGADAAAVTSTLGITDADAISTFVTRSITFTNTSAYLSLADNAALDVDANIACDAIIADQTGSVAADLATLR